MKIKLKKYYPHPCIDEEGEEIVVSEEIAALLEQMRRENDNYYLRRRRARAFYSLDAEDGIESAALFRVETPEEIYMRKLSIQQLNRALAKLPIKQSQYIYAYFFLEKSYTEIAKAYGVSVWAISKSIKAGLKNLERILKMI